MTYQAGIDLGTTYTAAAVHRDGRVEVVSLADRATVIPSVLFLRPDGDLLAGDPANRRGLQEPDRVAREFKRRVGDTAPLYLGGTPLGAHLLLARLLRTTLDRVAEREGGYPSALAITHPANWGPYKLDLLQQAVVHAGFGEYPTTFLSEPEAAAIHYASQERVAPGAIVAAYDLGGGTFDAAVLQRDADGGFSVLGRPDGVEHLGGIDFDGAVVQHVDQAVGGAVSGLDVNDPEAIAAVARLRQECSEAKEVLSSDTEVSIPVVLPTLRTSVRLLRTELETMIRPALEETIAALQRALRSAGVAPEQLQSVLLVGGSSRIPLVSQMVSAELARPVAVDAHPKHAVALGAAVAAAQLVGAAAVETMRVTDPPVAGAPAGSVPAAVPTWGAVHGGDGGQPPSGATSPERGGRRKVPVVAVIGVAALVAAGLGVALAGGGSSGGADDPATTTSAAVEEAAGGVDPISGQPVVADRGDAWVFPSSVGGLERQGVIGIDLASGEVLARANTEGFPAIPSPIVTDDAVWSIGGDSPVVMERFSRDDGSLLGRVELPVDGTADFVGAIQTADAIWVAVAQNAFGNQPNGRVFRVVEDTAQVNLTLEIPGTIDTSALATDGDRVWLGTGVVATDLGIVTIEDDEASDPFPIPGAQSIDDLGFSGGSVWVLGDDLLFELDPDTLRASQTISLGTDPVAGNSDLLFTEDAVSVVSAVDDAAVLLSADRASGEVTSAELGAAVEPNVFLGAPAGVDGDGNRWVYGAGDSANDLDAELTRVDPDGELSTLTLPAQPGGGGTLAFAGGRVAVSDLEGGGRLTAPLVRVVDGDDNSLQETVRADLYPLFITPGGSQVLVTDLDSGTSSVITDDDELVGRHETSRVLWPAVLVGDESWTLTLDGVEILDLDDPEADPEQIPLQQRRSPLVTDGERVLVRTDPWTVIDPATRTVSGQVPTTAPQFIQANSEPLSFLPEVVAFGGLWESGSEASSRIDLATGAVASVAVPAADFAIGDDEIWATDDDGGVFRLDPATGATLTTASVSDQGGRVVVDGDAVWFFDGTRDIHRLDPATGEEIFSVDLPGTPESTTFAAGSLWCSIEDEDLVVRVDPTAEFSSDAVVTTIEVGRRPAYLVGDDDGIWVALQGDLAIARIDPDRDEVVDTIELRD